MVITILTIELQRVFILLCWKMEPRCRQANNRKVRAVCQRERESAAPQDPCSICLALAARAGDRSPSCTRAGSDIKSSSMPRQNLSYVRATTTCPAPGGSSSSVHGHVHGQAQPPIRRHQHTLSISLGLLPPRLPSRRRPSSGGGGEAKRRGRTTALSASPQGAPKSGRVARVLVTFVPKTCSLVRLSPLRNRRPAGESRR